MSTVRLTADERMKRLLAAIPWIAEHEGPTVDEVCQRFGYHEQELTDDLNLLFVCGVYPFTPDSLMEAEIYDGRVWIHYADYFARPTRLTASEGLAVLSAGRALLAIPGADESGALGRALVKLAAVLGIDPDETLDIELGEFDADVLNSLKLAQENRNVVRFRYYSFGKDEWSDRTVEPYDVFAANGEWYMRGRDRMKNAERLFRLDRIFELMLTEESFENPEAPPRVIFDQSTNDRRVVIDLPRKHWWVLETHPVESVSEINPETKRVTMRFSGDAFLARLLLRLGSDVETTGAETIAQQGAQRILARYQRSSR